MTKADWLDFFEAINGRSATPEEIAAALAAGEFQDDATPTVEETVTVDETAVQETAEPVTPVQEAPVHTQPATPVQEVPVQAVPNQGAQATVNTAFAGQATQGQPQGGPFVNGQPVGPGQQVQFINGQAVVVPAQPSAFATTFKNYWTWLLNAWKRPADMTNYGKHNGWLNYIFLSVLTTFALFFTARSMAGGFLGGISSLTAGYVNPSNPIGFVAFIAFLFASFLFIFAFILAQFVTRKAVHRDPATTFVNSFDRFGRLTALALPILLGASLMSIVGLSFLSIILIELVFALFSLANLYTIVPVTTAWKADKFYQLILASLLNGVILSILFAIAFMMVGSFLVGVIF